MRPMRGPSTRLEWLCEQFQLSRIRSQPKALLDTAGACNVGSY